MRTACPNHPSRLVRINVRITGIRRTVRGSRGHASSRTGPDYELQDGRQDPGTLAENIGARGTIPMRFALLRFCSLEHLRDIQMRVRWLLATWHRQKYPGWDTVTALNARPCRKVQIANDRKQPPKRSSILLPQIVNTHDHLARSGK